MRIPFDNSYARLPERFYARLAPVPVKRPQLLRVNRSLALQLGIDPGWLCSPEGVDVLAGNQLPEGASPLAQAYAGHQFGGWVPQLGDGRALLLGEVVATNGQRYDLQLKGSGRTPWSRGGDGRAPLGPVIREYLVSEAMYVLGIPTTRSLAAVATGEPVYRERAEPGGVLTRVAGSHIRVGTVQYFSARQDVDGLQLLVSHVIDRHYPAAAQAEIPAAALLEAVITAQAQLVARWQSVGFIHGVMNTDNMLLSGETIDYGPCAFMDTYHPTTVYSSIDQMGRYAFDQQPAIAHWNLACLAQSLLPVLAEDPASSLAIAQQSVDAYPDLYSRAYRHAMMRKLGLHTWQDDDANLIKTLLDGMAAANADFTLTFRRLGELAGAEPAASVRDFYELPPMLSGWVGRWKKRFALDTGDPAERQAAMLRANPVFIPRNHLVEAAIRAAVDRQDYGPFRRLGQRLDKPFDFDPEDQDLALPPRPEQVVHQTFCGT